MGRVHLAQLLQIRVHQDRRFERHPVGVTGSFVKHIVLTTDDGRQRHHVTFSNGIDGRVGHLGKLLTEKVVQQPWLLRQHSGGGVIAHRPHCFLTVFGQYRDHLL